MLAMNVGCFSVWTLQLTLLQLPLSIQMWSLEFVEVAAELKVPETNRKEGTMETTQTTSATSGGTAGRMSMSSAPVDIPDGEKTRAEILQEFKDPEQLAAKVKLGSSADSEANSLELLKGQYNDIAVTPPSADCDNSMSPGDSFQVDDGQDSADFSSLDSSLQKSLGVDTGVDALTALGSSTHGHQGHDSTDAKVVDPKSKASQSPTDFEVVTDADVKDAVQSVADIIMPPASRRRHLREGFRWQRQLVFRSKLTMHTAFERKDNKDPAAVTALAVSK